MIITKWAKKILYKNKENFHRENKTYKAKKVVTQTSKANSTTNQKSINQLYQEQAKIIFNMINKVSNGDQGNS